MVSSREQRADFFVKHPKSREQVAERSQQGVKEQGAKSSCSLPNLLLALCHQICYSHPPLYVPRSGEFYIPEFDRIIRVDFRLGNFFDKKNNKKIIRDMVSLYNAESIHTYN